MMTDRENLLRAVRFERPERVPMGFHFNGACWHHYPDGSLQELMAAHPLLFPGFDPATFKPPEISPNLRHVDAWGCVWETTDPGITGTVTQHPLADWSALDQLLRPDPGRTNGYAPLDWDAIGKELQRARAEGRLAAGSLTHGHTFMTLCNLRGYENLLYDMADDDPRLRRLLGLVEDFNLGLVERWLARGVEWMGYPEDLGTQNSPMLSPELMQRFLLPTYRRIMDPARRAGVIVHMHSDGCIRDIADLLVEGGVEVINLQDLVNGIDWIRERFAGRVCIDLDIDRQRITRFGTPAQIDALLREEVEQLGSREGGLTLIFGLYPGTPLANVHALMDAMERYGAFYA